jgi:hypothetical protein
MSPQTALITNAQRRPKVVLCDDPKAGVAKRPAEAAASEAEWPSYLTTIHGGHGTSLGN